MQNFKSFVVENTQLKPHWTKDGGGSGYYMDGNETEKYQIDGIKNLVTTIFGQARGSGSGSASTAATARVNKATSIQYGFSNAILQSYFKLNGKELKTEKQLVDFFEKNAYEFDYMHVMPFGKTGYLVSHGMDEGFAYFVNARALMNDTDFLETSHIKEIDKLR